MEDVAAFRARARQWLESTVQPLQPSNQRWGEGELNVEVFHDFTIEEEREHLRRYVDWHQRRLAAGFGLIDTSPDWGGQGLTKSHERAYTEQEADFDVPPSHELISVTTKLVAPTIVDFGTPEQQEQFVGKFLRAEEYCCQLFSEPEAGSDLAGLTTKAVRDGDEYVVHGAKVWTTKAPLCEMCLLLVRTTPRDQCASPTDGMTLLLVDLQRPEVDIRPIPKLGRNAVVSCEVRYDGLRVLSAGGHHAS